MHGLARAGFVQWQLHPGRCESDLMVLSPALDAPNGHPAIWHKLLAESAIFLADQQIRRLYSELSDQPLLINTFMQAGFHLYARETVWRLVTSPPGWSPPVAAALRPQTDQDQWALEQLYTRITPAPVRQSEATIGESDSAGETFAPPILTNRYLQRPWSSFVLDGADGIDGCVQIVWGKMGVWLWLWVDSNDPNTDNVHHLLRFGLQQIIESPAPGPVYISVRDYQSALASILEEYGFAPFTDRVRMVRAIWQRAKKTVESRLPALDTVREALPGSLFAPPGGR